MNSKPPDITGLLNRWRDGDRLAEEDLFIAVLPNLRRLAQQYLNRERPGHTLQATELVDQMYLKLVNAKNQSWRNRGHFFAIVARAMRRYLIDHARGRPVAKFVALEGLENVLPANSEKTRLALSVDELLEEMGQVQPDWVQVRLSTLEFTGTVNISRIDGPIHHYTTDDCNFRASKRSKDVWVMLQSRFEP